MSELIGAVNQSNFCATFITDRRAQKFSNFQNFLHQSAIFEQKTESKKTLSLFILYPIPTIKE